jgi:hypothetical protein
VTEYPRDEDVWLMLADDVRPDLGNKLQIIGYYVGGDIIVQQENTLAPSLALLFIARGGEGFVEWSMSLTVPAGAPQPPASTDRMSVELVRAVPFVQAIKYIGFPLVLGVYTVTITFDEKVYRRSFEVKKQASS